MEFNGLKVQASKAVPEGKGFIIGDTVFMSPAAVCKLELGQEETMNAAVSETIMDATKGKATKVVDEIVAAATYIETLDKDKILAEIPRLIEQVDQNYFKLGGVLVRFSEEGWWKDMEYDSFRDCLSDQFGLQYRKAMYLMSIYTAIVEAEISWETVAPIGWTKLREISSIITKENAEEWVAKIMGPPAMTVLQIQEAVKVIKVGSLPSSGEIPTEEAKVSTLTFKLHPDQKENIEAAVAKAMGEAGTEFKGVALDAICMNYLSGGNVKPKALSDLLKAYQPEEVLEAFAVVWPDIDITASM